MPNRVFRNEENLIEQVYEGDQTSETVHDVIKQTIELAKTFHGKAVPSIIVDLTSLGASNKGSRTAAVEGLNTIIYRRIALYGGTAFVKYLSNLLILAAKKSRQVRFFSDRASALAWLLES